MLAGFNVTCDACKLISNRRRGLGGPDGNNVLPNARIRLKDKKMDRVRELPTQPEIEERVDFNLLPLSLYEFNLWNNG